MNCDIKKNQHPLIQYAIKQWEEEKNKVHLIEGHPEEEEFLSPKGKYPHAYVLACIMDRQIKAENAWIIPRQISSKIGGFDIELLRKVPLDRFKEIFKEESKHRFKELMAEYFHAAVVRIVDQYGGDARRIWSDEPSSAMLICRFLQFKGVGIKIATMATNILVRQFDICLKDTSSIDISPDVHVLRIFKRLGLISSEKPREEAIYMARALSPEYPGISDYSCWYVGKNFCHSKSPNCRECPFKSFCAQVGIL